MSTPTRWLSGGRDVGAPVAASVDLHADLKRLRQENAVLKQERDILKKAAAFFANHGAAVAREWARGKAEAAVQVDD